MLIFYPDRQFRLNVDPEPGGEILREFRFESLPLLLVLYQKARIAQLDAAHGLALDDVRAKLHVLPCQDLCYGSAWIAGVEFPSPLVTDRAAKAQFMRVALEKGQVSSAGATKCRRGECACHSRRSR